MAFGDLDSVSTTSMQNWAFTNKADTPSGKTEELFQVESAENEQITWIPEWKKWNDYYRSLPEIAGQIDTLALWVAGLGWESEKKALLEKIRGNGIDIFDSIIMNMIQEYLICGDAFASIVKDAKGRLINLKPLSPGSIKIIADKSGMIKGYEQISSSLDHTTGKKAVLETWNPEEMFHLAWNRVGMQIHGIPLAERLESQIKKINMAKDITSVIHRRHAVPVKIWEIDEDDPAKAATFKTKIDTTFKDVENIIVPMGSAKATVLQMQKGSIEEGISWIRELNDELVRGSGVPNVAQGSETGSSEATSKIIHLNFQPRANWHRIFLEKQIMAQLKIDITFNEPPSIDPALLTDARKNTGDDVKDVGVNLNEN